MKLKKSVFFFLFFLISASFSAFSSDLQLEREPSQKSVIESQKTKIIFKSEIQKADVFINGIFYGKTNLEVNSLSEGFYSVQISKKGYKTESFYILVQKGICATYEISLNF